MLIASHISLEICSRTQRAFSRASVMQVVTAFGLPSCHSTQSLTLTAGGLVVVLEHSDPRRRALTICSHARAAIGDSASSRAWKLTSRSRVDVLGPLEVARHPVERVGDPGEHQSRSTQVSLLPPPCEELTTSEPSRSATRVRPPGTIADRVAVEDERPQVDVARLEARRRRRSGARERDHRLRDVVARARPRCGARNVLALGCRGDAGPISMP